MTPVDICNLALGRLSTASISSLTDDSPQAEQCNLFWDKSRISTLAKHEWSFALGEKTLTLLDETSNLFDFVYLYPSDVVKARYLLNAADISDRRIKYLIRASANADKKVILTDEADAILIYTRDITNSELFSDDFAEAMSYLMAGQMAISLKGDAQLGQSLMQTFNALFNFSAADDANETRGPIFQDNQYYDCR